MSSLMKFDDQLHLAIAHDKTNSFIHSAYQFYAAMSNFNVIACPQYKDFVETISSVRTSEECSESAFFNTYYVLRAAVNPLIENDSFIQYSEDAFRKNRFMDASHNLWTAMIYKSAISENDISYGPKYMEFNRFLGKAMGLHDPYSINLLIVTELPEKTMPEMSRDFMAVTIQYKI